MVRIKICGITCRQDALAAVRAGADTLGFVFYERSPRHIPPEQAAAICRCVPATIGKVGVFVDEDLEEVKRTHRKCGLTAVQLHGSESPEFCESFSNVAVWKAFRIRSPRDLASLSQYSGVDAILVDGFHPDQRGGSGVRAPWSLLEGLSRRVRLILAGGLTPENIQEAVRRVAPFMVDVSSGVERAPGKKDPGRMIRLIQTVRALEPEG